MAINYPFDMFAGQQDRTYGEGDLIAFVEAIDDPDRRDELRSFVLEYSGNSWSVPPHLRRVIWQALRLRAVDDAKRHLEAIYPELRPISGGEMKDEWS